jgi:hypothetical protein
MAGLLVSFTLISSPIESWGQVGPGAATVLNGWIPKITIPNITPPIKENFQDKDLNIGL